MTSSNRKASEFVREYGGFFKAVVLSGVLFIGWGPGLIAGGSADAFDGAQPGPFDFGYLTATDDLGRTLPHYGEVPEPREDRYVGIFYFLWLGQHDTSGPYNITEILAENPEAVHDPEHASWGPRGAFHHWGEPLFDYYFSSDPWVIRRHAQMLTAAQIDFLVFDATNAISYPNVYNQLLEIFDNIRRQGWNVPRVVFYTNTASGATIEQIYEDLYKPGRYPDLWFQFEDKPLIIGNPDEVSQEIRDFFTFRLNQWPIGEPKKPYGFPWISFQRPQEVFYVDGEPENVNVAVGVHNALPFSDEPFYGFGTNWSRSFHNGARDPDPDAYLWGYNFAEQWEHAIAVDPRLVMVTGWNEWVAQRFDGPEERPIFFVDQATVEFSRDAEPMKGGYKDNYYLQMVDFIRRFKGLGTQAFPGCPQSIHIDDAFGQWEDVQPTYRDFVGDTESRLHRGFGLLTIYTDDTGRNDLEIMKVARDAEAIYFYARTVDPIVTDDTNRNWMMLFIKSAGDGEPDWEGYQFVVNRTVIDETTTTLEVSRGGWDWERVGELEYRKLGNEFHVAVPRSLLGIEAGEPVHIEFKWVDNTREGSLALLPGEAATEAGLDVMDFYLHGDAAPDGRFTYLYTDNATLLNAADPPPIELEMISETDLQLSWRASDEFVFESTPTLAPAFWIEYPGEVDCASGRHSVVVPIDSERRGFFRLRRR